MANAPPPPYSEVAGEKSGPYAPAYPSAPGYGTTTYPQSPPQAGYPQPQPGYQTGTAHNTVVVSQPAGMAIVQVFHETPVRTTCPFCSADIVTSTRYEAGTFSWLICVILCLLGFIWGCCLIPFCVEGCQDVVHVCPNCQQQISRWGRM